MRTTMRTEDDSIVTIPNKVKSFTMQYMVHLYLLMPRAGPCSLLPAQQQKCSASLHTQYLTPTSTSSLAACMATN